MTHASVFSGIGGPEVAATMLGWKNLFHCEINPFGRAVLDYWYPNAKSYGDITKTDFTEWRGRIDVLTGGFPCQPFSYAGQRRGHEDDRYLWPSMFRCINEVRPRWVVAENVAGILSMVEQGQVSAMAVEETLFPSPDELHRYQLRETFTLERICTDLESHGYAVQPVLIPACSVGAPHRRDRVFIIGRCTDTADTDTERQRRRGEEDRRQRTDTAASERRELQRESERHGSSGTTPGTCKSRTEGVRQERQDAIHRPHAAADTYGWRGFEVEQRLRLYLANGHGSECPRSERTTPDTTEQCNEQLRPKQCEHRLSEQEQSGGGNSEDESIAGCCRWQWSETGRWLPTQSPIHRGNDGIPFPVDSLTIPFLKWRTEALKAYGNAIVPQVIYEIFRAIEITEQAPTP